MHRLMKKGLPYAWGAVAAVAVVVLILEAIGF